MCCLADPRSMLLMGCNAIELVCVCFVCFLCFFAGVHNDAIPMCAYGVVG